MTRSYPNQLLVRGPQDLLDQFRSFCNDRGIFYQTKVLQLIKADPEFRVWLQDQQGQVIECP